MTNSHSSEPDNPLVSWVRCDGCGDIYEELSAIAWGRRNGLLKKIFCIGCDTAALRRPDVLITQTGKDS